MVKTKNIKKDEAKVSMTDKTKNFFSNVWGAALGLSVFAFAVADFLGAYVLVHSSDVLEYEILAVVLMVEAGVMVSLLVKPTKR